MGGKVQKNCERFIIMISAMKTKKDRHRLWYRPTIEPLEERALLSTDTWTGTGGDNLWSNPLNWDTQTVPNPGDDLVFVSSFSPTPPSINDLLPDTTFNSITFANGQPTITYVTELMGNTEPPTYIQVPVTTYPPNEPPLEGNSVNLTGAISSIEPSNIDFDGISLGANLTVSGANISSPFDLNGFTLSGTGNFSGPFIIDGPIQGAAIGAIAITGPITQTGLATLSGVRFAGPVTLTGPAILSNVIIDGPITLGPATLSNASITAPVTLGGPATFSGVNATDGINVNGFDLTLGRSTITGPISGTGSITVVNGFTSLDSNSSEGVSTFTGVLTVNSGATASTGAIDSLNYLGNLNTGPTILNGGSLTLNVATVGAVTVSNGGTLQAKGSSAGSVNVSQGLLIPGPLVWTSDFIGGVNDPGLFKTNSLTLSPGATLQLHIAGTTPGVDYSQVQASGPIDLGGATLELEGGITSSPAGYVILESPESITGTFNGLPDGASIMVGNQTLEIHYLKATPGFPARVVLVNDTRVTYSTLISLPNPFPQTPLLTATVANIGAPPVNGGTTAAQGEVTFMEGHFDGPNFVTSPLGDSVPLVNGVARLIPLLPNVLHNQFTFSAVYTPSDSTFLASSSAPFDQIINPVDMGWRDVTTGDFNGDGKQDIIGRTAAGQWWVGISDGSGSFSNQLWTTWNEAAGWQDVQVGDFNGDGKADIAGRTASGDWWVAISNGSSFTNSFWGHWNPNATWVDVKVGDFNGDGNIDIVGRWLQTGQWCVAQSTGSSFTNSWWGTWNPAATWVDVQVADFDGNGKADLTGRYLQGGSWWTALSKGSSFTTSLWATWNPAATWVDVKAGDFDGDGKADITGRWLEGGYWYTAISNGTSFTTTQWGFWNPNATWVDVQMGDFDGDGKADITGRWLEGGQWWTATSTGSSFNTNLWASWNPNVTWVDSLSADFTGDGKTDLTSRYQQGGQWWTATSSGSDFATSLWTTWPA
jgi:hypothetical protein